MLGAVGIILPLVIDVLPLLTPITAYCMGIVLLAAPVVHLKGKQFATLPILLFLLALAITITISRYL